MKLVGKLKDKVEKAETKEQAKELIANAGMELTDEEMDKVSGGITEEARTKTHNRKIDDGSACEGNNPACIGSSDNNDLVTHPRITVPRG